MAKVKVAELTDVPAGAIKQVKVAGKDDIALANIDGKIYAIRGICNHMGGPLGKGKLEGKVVTCPWHGSQWDVTTGKMVAFLTKLKDEPAYEVTVEAGGIFVDL
jgi:nitrite reductase/ring-hydroxylating ferredoxin subunit